MLPSPPNYTPRNSHLVITHLLQDVQGRDLRNPPALHLLQNKLMTQNIPDVVAYLHINII